MTIIWRMVPEIWHAADRIFFHSGPSFALSPPMDPENQNFEITKKTPEVYFHFTNVYHKWQSYDLRFLRYGVQRTKLFVILDRFLPFYPPNNPKNQNFERMKKAAGDIIILHRCTINDNHMMHGSWNIERGGQNFLSFWTTCCPSTLPATQKIKIFKYSKKHLKILSSYTDVP